MPAPTGLAVEFAPEAPLPGARLADLLQTGGAIFRLSVEKPDLSLGSGSVLEYGIQSDSAYRGAPGSEGGLTDRRYCEMEESVFTDIDFIPRVGRELRQCVRTGRVGRPDPRHSRRSFRSDGSERASDGAAHQLRYKRTASSDTDGAYCTTNLPVGPYVLQVSAQGFGTYTQSGIVIQVADNLPINVTLKVGAVSEEVQVTAAAPMVETESTSISEVMDQQRIVDLPLNGRTATALIMISGAAEGACGRHGDDQELPSSVTLTVAGGQPNGTNYLLDGGDNNDGFSNVNLPFPFPDALQEFSVQTTGLSARYGVHPGAVVNVVTKSGSNGFHGNLFEFLRNGDTNARNFFAATHDNLRRNQFGGTIGGPVRKDKLFFFLGYQGTRISSMPPQTISYVPTQQMRGGDFSTFAGGGCQSSGKGKTLTDPTTSQPFPGNIIPTSRFDTVALNIIQKVPVAANPCGQITYGIPKPEDETQLLGRVDFTRSEKHGLFGRYFIADYSNPLVYDNTNLLMVSRAGAGRPGPVCGNRRYLFVYPHPDQRPPSYRDPRIRETHSARQLPQPQEPGRQHVSGRSQFHQYDRHQRLQRRLRHVRSIYCRR